jgi:hypothetical protein
MRGGSATDRLKQGVSRDLHRVANKIGPVGPRLLQWLSDTGRGGFSRLRRLETRDWIAIAALFVSILALLVAGFSAFYTYKKVELTTQSLKQHLDPDLSCQLDNLSDQFSLFALENLGLIAAESVSVNHLTFRYEKTGEKAGRIITGFDLPTSGQPGFRWMYAPKLEPHERTPPKLTGQFVPPPNRRENETEIAILFFEISYLRPTDGNLYQKRCVFYKDGDGFQGRATFQANPHFWAVNEAMERGLAKVSLTRPGLGIRE